MPRNGANIYSKPAGSTAVSGTTIESAKYNSVIDDLVTDANTPRPVVAGGTGATSAAGALTALGLTATAAEINVLDGVTATTAELNILDGATLTVTELNYVDGVTSAIQTQLNAKLSNASPVPLANGGTGAALVDPNADRIMFWDDSAGAVTFLEAGTGLTITDTTITAQAGRVLLATKTASASATLDFTEFDNATYRRYEFELENVKPATDSVSFYFRTSTNSGSTYDAGASDYAHGQSGTSAASATTGASLGASAILLNTSVTIGNAASEYGLSGELVLTGAPSAAVFTELRGMVTYWNAAGAMVQLEFGGARLSADDVDAVQFLFSSGNIASGTIRMYGII